MATAAKATRVFEGMRCPLCGEEDTLHVRLDDLAVECTSCGEVITRGEVEEMIARWQQLWAWIDSAATFAAPK